MQVDNRPDDREARDHADITIALPEYAVREIQRLTEAEDLRWPRVSSDLRNKR
jgi:hypothetical protein